MSLIGTTAQAMEPSQMRGCLRDRGSQSGPQGTVRDAGTWVLLLTCQESSWEPLARSRGTPPLLETPNASC